MNDAAVAFALIAVAVLGWLFAGACFIAFKGAQADRAELDDCLDAANDHIGELQDQLANASKNDNRDPNTGRFVRAS